MVGLLVLPKSHPPTTSAMVSDTLASTNWFDDGINLPQKSPDWHEARGILRSRVVAQRPGERFGFLMGEATDADPSRKYVRKSVNGSKRANAAQGLTHHVDSIEIDVVRLPDFLDEVQSESKSVGSPPSPAAPGRKYEVRMLFLGGIAEEPSKAIGVPSWVRPQQPIEITANSTVIEVENEWQCGFRIMFRNKEAKWNALSTLSERECLELQLVWNVA